MSVGSVPSSVRQTPSADARRIILPRLRAFLASWPSGLRGTLATYRGEGPRTDRPEDGPIWLLLPVWLWDRHCRAASSTHGEDFLGDILWGQYCLFSAVRIRDDLLDAQTAGRDLDAAAGRFLRESRRCIRRRFSAASPVLSLLDAALETTGRSIREVDRLQRSAAGMPPGSLELYARVGEVLKLGATAVCIVGNRYAEIDRIGRFCDQLAIAEQIVDDLVDQGEDLVRGRLNFATSTLLRRARNLHADIPGSVLRDIIRGEISGEFVAEARRRLGDAARAIAPLGLAAVPGYLRRWDQQMAALPDVLRDAATEILFGNGASGARSSGS